MEHSSIKQTHNKNTRYCLSCGSDETYRNKWYRYESGYICKNCYSRLIDNPNKNRRRLMYKYKHILLKDNPRTGICSLCRKQGITQLHHIKYDDNNVLKYTIELCINCHNQTKPRNSKGQFEKQIGREKF